MKKILILFAHPAFTRSKVNAAMRKSVEDLENITYHDLYASYPDFYIDVAHEQELCMSHDVLIFQHPLYWYSTPSILKEWLDLVFQHNWAYGHNKHALAGKYMLQALTAGGDYAAYDKDKNNLFTLRELTSPYRATAHLCKMEWLPPFAVLGIHRGLTTEKIQNHAEEYRRAVLALRDNTMDIAEVQTKRYLNSDLNLTANKG